MDASALPAENPPASSWSEVDRAAQAALELERAGLEIHFQHPGAGRRVAIELRRRGNEAGRSLTPSEAIALALGESI